MRERCRLPQARPRTASGSWPWGILSHWVPAHHLPSGPHLTSCLSSFTQTHSSSHCLLMTKLVPIPGPSQELFSLPGTLRLLSSPGGTLLKRSSHREDVVNHLSDTVPLLLPSWCPVTFRVHTLCKHVFTDDYGFNVHLSPLCSTSTRITLHAGGGIHIC